MFLYLKALHLIAVICWFAGLFYLPRLFVYHAQSTDAISHERFKIMERKLYYGIMTPSAVLTILFGGWILVDNLTYYKGLPWFHLKLGCVLLLIIFHLYCGKVYRDFKYDRNTHSARFYKIINEIPTLLLIVIVFLVILKPPF